MIDRFDGPYRFLSNFHEGDVIAVPWGIYDTGEHAFAAVKTTDMEKRAWVGQAGGPGIAKRRGRNVPLRPDWENIKIEAMRVVIAAKFGAGTSLAGLLLETGDQQLVEGNAWGDKFWGCVSEGGVWVGRNELGRLLMRQRSTLRVVV